MRHVVFALLLAACGTSTTGHKDGGGGTGGSGGGDMAMAGGDMALPCHMPGRCSVNGGSGICCWHSIGPHQSVFCDPADCQLEHGVDNSQSPLCNTAADCYAATRTDMGTLFCCPDATYPVNVCRFMPCPGTP